VEHPVAKKQADLSSKAKRAPRGAAKKPSKTANAVVSGADMTEDNKRTGSAAATRKAGLSSEVIGQTAGEVWRVLSERGAQTIPGIKKSVDTTDELIMAALGWLAREDKLAFETNGRSVSVSLV
jgi:hypothetical protein